jgi:hypothetical protein
MKSAQQRLKERIALAFAAVKAPEEIAVRSDWDSKQIAKDFAPYIKQSVPAQVLESHAKSLPAFTPRAFAFFLKDYLLYAVDHPPSELTENLIYRLGSAKEGQPYWAERVCLFSNEQRNVVAGVCDFLMEQLPRPEKVLREDLQRASSFWKARDFA